MAEWKALGYVPDSDEEDDSQSTESTNVLGSSYLSRDNDNKQVEEHSEYNPAINEGNNRVASTVEDPKCGDGKTGVALGQSDQNDLSECVSIDHKFESLGGSSAQYKRDNTSLYDDVDELGQYHYESARKVSTDGPVQKISQMHNILDTAVASFPQISSRISRSSSILSSIPSSPNVIEYAGNHGSPTTSEAEIHSEQELNSASAIQSSTTGHGIDVVVYQQAPVERTTTSREGRSFRQRNPIQLHPYAIESEKYRQSLKARGIKPLHILHTQNEHGAAATDESQPFQGDLEQESQSLNDDVVFSSRASFPLPGVSKTVRSSNSVPDGDMQFEEEDLPDLASLLRSRPSQYSSVGNKRRKPNHAFSKKHHPSSNTSISLQSKNVDPPAQVDVDASMYDIPASAPSSSHLSQSSPEAFAPKFKVPRRLTPFGLPTPLTSSEPRRRPQFQLFDSEESDTPVDSAIERDHVSVQSSEDDELPQDEPTKDLEQAQRRIRGVLPASWLRLDQKLQIANPSKAHRVWQDPPPEAPNAPRGVAKVVARPRIKNPAQIVDFLEVLSGAEDPAEQSEGSESLPELDLGLQMSRGANAERREVPYEYGAERSGEVDEDNRVDAMLPSSKSCPITSSKSSKSRSKKNTTPEISAKPPISYKPRKRHQYQPKISDRLVKKPLKASKFVSAKIGILDALARPAGATSIAPHFLRIASRTARLRNDKGRHSPTGKTMKLANDQDTYEMDTTLQHWREGTIRPQEAKYRQMPRRPLEPTSGNGKLSRSLSRSTADVGNATGRVTSSFSKTTQSKNKKIQRTLDNIIQSKPQRTTEPRPRQYKHTEKSSRLKEPLTRGHVSSALRYGEGARPALLETLQAVHDCSRPEAAFGRELVQVNRRSKKTEASILLRSSSFDYVAPPRTKVAALQEQSPLETGVGPVGVIQKRPKAYLRKKRSPKRYFIDSVPDRPSSDPGVGEIRNDISDDAPLKDNLEHSVFLNLVRFGGHYPSTFEVNPLPTGTCFPKDTFVGGGEFHHGSAVSISRDLDKECSPLRVPLPTRTTFWSQWNDVVSTEMSQIFDEILAFVESLSSADPLARTGRNSVTFMQMSIFSYMASHLSFIDAVDRVDCLQICTGLVAAVVQELAGLEAPANQVAIANEIPIIDSKIRHGTMNLCIVDQLGKIANHDLAPPEVREKVNGLKIKNIHYILSLVLRERISAFQQCLQEVRPLEGCEHIIQANHAPLEAFVICHNILMNDSSSAAFWEIVNDISANNSGSRVVDVRSFEQLWQTLFTLLPFLEINSKGVVEVGRRFNIQCDNWPPIKNSIGQFLDACTAVRVNQPSMLNTYCRALFSRCFHLITDWNWARCESIVGILFDFFARNNLAHLKHEDCHGSPAFLERLAENPCLGISSNDRCFHILLKIIARGLQKMRLQYPAKKIRDNVWRLMPNHGRSHPKEQALRQEDLDALRNHHDLLCTLYWASPPEFRPRLTVLRNLVNVETSHREACHLNIHAWSNLVRFQLSVQEPLSSLQPFADWHDDLLMQILRQHAQARSEAEEQARLIEYNGGLEVSRDLLETTIARNQRQVEGVLGDALVRLQLAIAAARNPESANLLLTSAIIPVFNLLDARQPQSNTVIVQALDVLLAYLKHALPLLAPSKPKDTNDDSQDYGDWSVFAEDDTHGASRAQAAIHFRNIGEAPLRNLLSNCFGADDAPKDDFLAKVVDVWSTAALMFVSHGMKSWSDYLGPYGQDSWCSLRQTQQARRYRACFLAHLVEVNEDIYFEQRQQFLRSWMESLVERESLHKFQHRLTSAVLNVDSANSLLGNLPFWANKNTGRFDITSTDFSLRRLSLISSVLSNMRESLESAEFENSKVGEALKQNYKELLRHLMTAMKHNYQELGPTSNVRGAYVDFAHRVVEFLQQHTSSICPVDRFFTDSSAFPLPMNDPLYVVAQLKHYGLRLQDRRIPRQLAIFLQSVSERAATEGQQQYLTDQLYASMSGESESGDDTRPTLRSFLVKVITPAYIKLGFSTSSGWVLLLPFLQALQKAFEETLDVLDGSDVASVAAVASMLDCFLGSLRGFCQHLTDNDENVLSKPEMLRMLGDCFKTITPLLPALDYLTKLGGPVRSSIDCAEYLRSFASFTTDAGMPDHDLDHNWDYRSEIPPHFKAVQEFALRELQESVSKCWTQHDGRIYVTRGNARKEVIMNLGSYEEEMGGFLTATQTFLSRLQSLPTFRDPDEEDLACELRRDLSLGDLLV